MILFSTDRKPLKSHQGSARVKNILVSTLEIMSFLVRDVLQWRKVRPYIRLSSFDELTVLIHVVSQWNQEKIYFLNFINILPMIIQSFRIQMLT